jgi:thymidylate synthase
LKINLNPYSISVKTLPEAWFACIRGLIHDKNSNIAHTYTINQGSYVGIKRLEYDYVTVNIEFPGSHPRIPDVPIGIPNPSSDKYVEEYLPYLMCSSKKPNEQYTYGEFLEPQIKKVIEKYKSGPGNNQCYMVVGDPTCLDLPDPPCLRGIDTRVLDGKLHFMVYFRSWDLWAGFPNNLAAIQLLKEYMAYEMGLVDGNLIAASKGLHLYEYVWDMAKQVVDR